MCLNPTCPKPNQPAASGGLDPLSALVSDYTSQPVAQATCLELSSAPSSLLFTFTSLQGPLSQSLKSLPARLLTFFLKPPFEPTPILVNGNFILQAALIPNIEINPDPFLFLILMSSPSSNPDNSSSSKSVQNLNTDPHLHHSQMGPKHHFSSLICPFSKCLAGLLVTVHIFL